MKETAAAPARRREVMVVLPGLVLAMLLAMLDNMIVGAGAAHASSATSAACTHLSWVTTGYVLGTTVATPIWGKLGDLYGRQDHLPRLDRASSWSAPRSAAWPVRSRRTDMAELIGFRAVQGLGAGGLIVGVMAIIG